MDALLQDLRLGLRSLARTPAFTAAAVAAMALGIGGTSAIFAAFDTLLLRPLSLPQPERLVTLYERDASGATNLLSLANFRDFAAQVPDLESSAAYYPNSSTLMTPQGPEQFELGSVTASFMHTLGVHPALGRDLGVAEEGEAAPRVLLLSDDAWRRRFGGSSEVIGKSATVAGHPYTIVGVLPRGFSFPGLANAEALVPMRYGERELKSRGNHYHRGVARLRPSSTLEQASRNLLLVARRLATDFPATNTGGGAYAVGLLDDAVSNIREPLTLLLLAVAALLLVSCANVAGMLLARGAARQREVAIRAALGAGRARIARQLLVESTLLALCGGTLGLLLALWGVDALVALAPEGTPRIGVVHLDCRVTAITLGLSILVGLLAGAVPAFQMSRTDLTEALREAGQRGSGSPRKIRARSLLVVVEVALALMLVVVSGLLARSLSRVLDTGLGLDPANVLTIGVGIPGGSFKGTKKYSELNARLLDRVAAIPGVESAATVNAIPLTLALWSFAFRIEGRPAPLVGMEAETGTNWVTPGYFGTLRIPVRDGRDLAASDTYQTPKVLVVNEAFARRFFPGERPVGQHLRMLYDFEGEGEFTWEVVGVVGDVRGNGLDREPTPEVYISQTQQGFRAMNLILRTRSRTADIVRAVRAEVLALAPQQPLGRVQSMDELVAASVGPRRFQALLCSAFGLFALLLSALGLYGLIAYSVAQRTHEIGIRMALGAERGTVLRMVVGEGLRLAGLGLLLGLLGAFAASRALQSQLYGISASDPLTYAGVAALIAAVATLASLVPARRAASVPPLVALRSE